jgi:hypothetical protein
VYALLQSYVYVLSDGLLADPGIVVGHGPIELEEEEDEEEFDVIFGDDADKPAGSESESKKKKNDTAAQGKAASKGEL